MVKTLLIPLDWHKNDDDRNFGDMYRAFKAHGDALVYSGSLDKAIEFKPDLIFFQSGLSNEDCIKLKSETKAKWITWTGDVRYAPMQYLVDATVFTDFFFLPFNGQLLKNYRKILNRNCNFIFEPFQNWRFREPKELSEGNIRFVGNVYEHLPGGEKRIELYEFLGKHVKDIDIYGSFPDNQYYRGQISTYDVPDLYNNSYAVIATNNWSNIDWYFTPRNLTAMAAGSCCLMEYFPEINTFFTNWENCIIYRDKYELLDVVNFIKANPEIRNTIARNGYEHVKNYFNMDVWAKEFIDKACLTNKSKLL